MLDYPMGGNIQTKKIDLKTIEPSLIWIKPLARISGGGISFGLR